MKIEIRFRPEFLCVKWFRDLTKTIDSISRGTVIYTFLVLLSFSQARAQLPTDFQKVELLTGLANATTMKFAPDGRIFIVDRKGGLLIYKTDTQTAVSAGTLPVFSGFEDGFLGLAFDPNFTVNQKIYIYYSLNPYGANANRISQFGMDPNDPDKLDLSSEVPMMEWPVQRTNSFHAGGDMAFDSQGNLYIAVGDNSNHGQYGALDENNSDNSAEKSSSNTNDYRGKILRIRPNAADGSYTIPPGNLFPEGTPLTRPEIYVMGARNPYRIFVDKENTDWLFWGDVGPDASGSGVLGPKGLDEMNLTKTSGNYGWPHFSGVDGVNEFGETDFNYAYQIPYKTPSPFYNDPAAPKNTSIWNNGATDLPPAKSAWMEFFHKSHFAGPRYYYDGTSSDQQRLPIEFDGVFFYYDFNTSRIWAVKMDATGNILSNEQLAPAVFPTSANGFIDMKIGPDGHMYILEYGTGCCPSNTGTGKLVRVDFTGVSTNSPPNVVINADVTSGSLPLTVNFDSTGTTDPNGDTPLMYAWDFQSDGTVDATTANTSHTFTVAGTFNVQLRVDDGNGGVGVQNTTIHAGNNAATFSFNSPPDGGFVGWGDDINIDFVVNDQEDGSTGSGIDCTDIALVPSLGHLNHFHDGAILDGCPRTLTLQYEGHDIDGGSDLFYVLGTSYTDQGGLQAFDQIQLHPKRKEAEYFDMQSGVEIIPNTDPLLGGAQAIRVDNNGYISFLGRNLMNMTSVRYRVAGTMTGGTIEFRTGSSSGPILATTVVPVTGGPDNWTNIETAFADPGGKHDLFFVFKNGSVTQDIFDLNFVEFIGPGVSVDNSPPLVNGVISLSATEIRVEFSEYMDQSSAESLSNYTIDNGITVSNAVLLGDGHSVLLTVSPMNSTSSYNLTISNAQNMAGLPVATGTYPLTIISSVRINAGGPQVVYGSENFEADQNYTGGTQYSASIPISGTNDDAMYQTERFGSFTYEIPVAVAAEYDIRLHFAEIFFGVGSQSGGPGSRVFNVSIEGIQVLTNFDILSEVSPATALQKEFDDISITDGFASIQFSSVTQNPKISGIEILPSGTVDPVPDVTITSPSNGANVNQPFQVNFTVDNWTIEEGGTHMHYSIDGQVVGSHYNYGPITIDGLSLGSHSIGLELYDVGHVPTGIFHGITVNVTDQGVCNSTPFPDSWTVHQWASNPYTAVYTIPDYDLDGDGLKDIVTGGWWYKNPGSASGNWTKSNVGGGFGNVVHVHDFDGDGHMDLLGATLGSGTGNEYKSSQLLWAKNDGSGNFTVYTNIPAGNTTHHEPFLAGITGGNFGLGSPYQMAINWNGAESNGSPVQLLTPSADPTTGTWTFQDISNDSSGEDIKVGDVDGDGDLDLFQGINWLRNEGNGSWTTFSTGVTYVTTPDRIQLADFNGDGRLDGVVGQLGLGSDPDRSEFSWFEAPADPTQSWTRHILSTSVTGSLSVFAIDFDFDGDKDIVVGEWLGSRRLLAFENDLCNTGNWITHILDNGSLNLEHHDGAMVTDIDNDGDLDVISNGWISHKVPRIYENTTLSSGTQYALTVESGTGDGSYVSGSVVNITADVAPPGQEFDIWTGDIGGIADVNSASTTITMPTSDITVTATYRDIPTTGIIWLEDFTGLANGTTVDNGPTAWTSQRASGIFQVSNGVFLTNGNSTNPGVWTSGVIPINGTVSISLDVDDQDDNKETSDYMRAYYRLDGGSQIAFGSVSSNISPQSFTASNITGNTIQIIVESRVTFTDEFYTLDNITVFGESTGGTQYALTVESGAGDGSYVSGSVVAITADVAPPGQEFDIWTGDVGGIADVNSASTTITMPTSDITVAATYRDIPTTGIIWLEDFTGLANGTTVDNGPTAWTSQRASGIFQVSNGVFLTNGNSTNPGVWTSGVIPINGTVSISLDVDDQDDNKETSDYVRAYYRLDGGSQIMFGSVTDDISPQSFTASNITGNTIQIIVESRVTFTDEFYTLDNITVFGESTGGTQYALAVESGTGDGTYVSGSVVNITADVAPPGEEFNIWTGDIGGIADVNSASTTITMPTSDITVTATYIAISEYSLTVESGTGDGSYVSGSVVNITADVAPPGQEFDIWTGDIGGIADVNSASTTITMPTSDITVTATYRDIPTTGIIWLEDFTGLANGTTVDNGPTAWTSQRASGIFQVSNGVFLTNGNSTNPGVWTSGVIPINGTVSISLDVDDQDDNKETSDYMRAYYRLDGGSQIAFGSVSSNISPQSFTASNITGNTIQIIVESRVTFTDEFYTLDNITVFGESTGGTQYALTVESGAGDGSYVSGSVVAITADVAPPGQEFDIWTGDVGGIADVNSASTTITMPTSDITVTATYRDIPTTGIIWLEDFTGLANGTTVDNGPTAWTSQRASGIFQVSNGVFLTNGNSTNPGVWTSGVIPINGTVSISLDVDDQDDNKETSDYVRAYYRLDSGSQIAFGSLSSNISPQSFTASNITGNTIQIIVESRVTFTDEFYTLDNITVSGNTNTDKNTGTIKNMFDDKSLENMEEVSNLKILIFPNPTSKTAHIKVSDPNMELTKIYIFDNTGRLVKKIDVRESKIGENQYLLDGSGLEEGTYFVKLITKDATNYYNQLLIKKR